MNKKILVISRYHTDDANPIYNAYLKGISKNFDVYFIDYFDTYSMLGKEEFKNEILNFIEKENIENIFFMFVSGDATFDLDTLYAITKSRFTYMVFWDTEQFFEPIDRYYAQFADLVLIPTNYDSAKKYHILGIDAICTFSLFDTDKYVNNNLDFTQRDIDVSFVGEVTKGVRKEYIQYLEDNGINIVSYGAGTKAGKISFEQLIDIFNRSKISLNFSDIYDNSVYSFCFKINNRIKQIKGKPIEVALCGAMVLTEKTLGIENLFSLDTEIDDFNSKEELLQKIRYYLENANVMQKKANLAYFNAKEKCDSVIALTKIFNEQYNKKAKNKDYYYNDKQFIKVHNTFTFFYFWVYLNRGLFKKAFMLLKDIMKNKYLIYKDVFSYIKQYYIVALNEKLPFIFFFEQNKEYKRVLKKLEYIKSITQNEPIVLHGARQHTKYLLKHKGFRKMFNVVAISDKDNLMHGSSIDGIKIIKPDEIVQYSKYVILSSFNFTKQMTQDILAIDSTIQTFSLYDNDSKIDCFSNNIDRLFSTSNIYHSRVDIYKYYTKMLKYR